MLDGVLNPGFDWLDRYRHGSAKDRTAPVPLGDSFSSMPGRVCSRQLQLHHTQCKSRLEYREHSHHDMLSNTSEPLPSRYSETPSFGRTNKPLAHQQALVRRRSGCHLQFEDPGRLVARTIESTDSSGHSFNYQSQQGDHHVEPSY
jgi:hypothetical protein